MERDFYIVIGTNPHTGNQVDQDFYSFNLAKQASKNEFWATMDNVSIMKCVHTADAYEWIEATQ